MTKQLITGKYSAIRVNGEVTLYGSSQVRCRGWEVAFEQTPDRVQPPIHEFYLNMKENCYEIPAVVTAEVTLASEEAANWTYLLIRDASGDVQVPIADATIVYDPEVIWPASEFPTQYVVIAQVLTRFENCMVIPADSFFVATHQKVFGPDTFDECVRWQATKCGRIAI